MIVFAVAALLPTYLIRFRIGPFPTTLLEIILLAAIAILIIHSFCHPRENGGPEKKIKNVFLHFLDSRLRGNDKLLFIGSILIIVATIIGIVVAPDHRAALGIAKAYFWEPMLLAWLLIAAKPDRNKITKAAIYGFGLSALVIIVYGLIQYVHPALIPPTWMAERRITSVFDYPNAAALYLAPLVPLALAVPFGFIFSLFAFLIIILAKSAGGLIAIAAALFFLGIVNKKTRLPSIVIAIIVASVVIFTPAAGLRDQILMRDWSGRVHQIGWTESLAMLHDHPLFGAGLDAFKTVVAPYHHAQGVEIFQYPHDIFLTVWSELGLLGLAGFACIMIWFFKNGITPPLPSPIVGEEVKKRWANKFLVAAMIAILVHGLVDVPYFKNDLAMMFWLFIVLMAV